jgi:hypothetical protein
MPCLLLSLGGLALVGCDKLPAGPDTTPPTITIISPDDGTTATDTLVVIVSASDDRAIARVELFLDRHDEPVAVDSMGADGRYRLVVSLVDVNAGAHILTAKATDPTGNSAETLDRVFTAAKTPGLRYVSRITLDGSARDIAVSLSYAYVAAWDGGIVILDVANKFVPVTLGRFDTDGIANGVHVSGDRLFVADGDEGVLALSIVDPAQPEELARYKTAGMNAHDITTRAGTRAFVAGGTGGLFALDISNPDTLISLGVYNPDNNDVRDVEVSGDLVYTAEMTDGMRVVNVTRPDSMYAEDQYVNPGLAAHDVSLGFNLAAIAGGIAGVHVVDISVPDHISVTDFFSSGDLVSGVVSAGGLTYLSAGASGVQVIDSSDPADLQALTDGVFATGGISYKMDFSGGYLYVADNTQVTLLKYVAP